MSLRGTVGVTITWLANNFIMEKKTYMPYEPKRENRFILTLPEAFGLSEWMVRSVDMPSVEIGDGWNPMKIRFVDPVGPSVSQRLWALYNASLGTKDIRIQDFEKLCDLVQNGFDAKIELIDPTGVVISIWVLTGCKILRMDFGSLDYVSSEVITCGLTIRPTQATLLY
jgi:hypothetical protein